MSRRVGVRFRPERAIARGGYECTTMRPYCRRCLSSTSAWLATSERDTACARYCDLHATLLRTVIARPPQTARRRPQGGRRTMRRFPPTEADTPQLGPLALADSINRQPETGKPKRTLPAGIERLLGID